MKKYVIGFILTFSFIFGALTATILGQFYPNLILAPIATVTIKNNSKIELSSIRLKYQTGNIKSEAEFPPIQFGSSKSYRFYLAGEGDYQVEVIYANGNRIHGGEGYIEGGYSVTQTISDSLIQ